MVDSIVKQAFGINTLADIFKGFDGRFRKTKRALHDRSHLAIEFPQTDNRVVRAYVPFLENPQIEERGAARLNTYDLVGRAGQLFSYAGAESRGINITFNISLLHVIETNITEGIKPMFKRSFLPFFTDRARSKQLFELRSELDEKVRTAEGIVATQIAEKVRELKLKNFVGNPDQKVNEVGKNHASIHREYYREAVGALTGLQLQESEKKQLLAPLAQSLGIPSASQAFQELDENINLVYCWINLIRGSVMNNAKSSLYGPPIVRVTHGPMFNNVPCLLQDYSIRIEDDAGYDVQTLTPKRVNISLNLVEARTGTFGEYDEGFIADGDNLAGWESIIENNNADPYNGLIGQSREFTAQDLVVNQPAFSLF